MVSSFRNGLWQSILFHSLTGFENHSQWYEYINWHALQSYLLSLKTQPHTNNIKDITFVFVKQYLILTTNNIYIMLTTTNAFQCRYTKLFTYYTKAHTYVRCTPPPSMCVLILHRLLLNMSVLIHKQTFPHIRIFICYLVIRLPNQAVKKQITSKNGSKRKTYKSK